MPFRYPTILAVPDPMRDKQVIPDARHVVSVRQERTAVYA